MSRLLEPKEVPVELPDGTFKTYVLSKLPALDGRKVALQYPVSGLPKVGEYGVNEEMMLLLLSYVAVNAGGETPLRLTTRALIDNHVASWETLVKLEGLMISYNCSFFANGKALSFFDGLKATALQLISKTLTDSLGLSSNQEKQP